MSKSQRLRKNRVDSLTVVILPRDLGSAVVGAQQVDARGLASESHCCVDCGVNTHPGAPTRAEMEEQFRKNGKSSVTYSAQSEVYMVHGHVWAKAGVAPYGGVLCIGCLEKRIGRELRPEDFPADHSFMSLPGTSRLLRRQGRRDPLSGWQPAKR
jgi:hypothetical protein